MYLAGAQSLSVRLRSQQHPPQSLPYPAAVSGVVLDPGYKEVYPMTECSLIRIPTLIRSDVYGKMLGGIQQQHEVRRNAHPGHAFLNQGLSGLGPVGNSHTHVDVLLSSCGNHRIDGLQDLRMTG